MTVPLQIIRVFLPQTNPDIVRGRNNGKIEAGIQRGNARRVEFDRLVDRLTRALRKQQHLAAFVDSASGFLDNLSKRIPARIPVDQDHWIFVPDPSRRSADR